MPKNYPAIMMPLKLWIYKIAIPGGIPKFPEPWYHYWGITTEEEPMDRISLHPIEPKSNHKFEEIRKLVPFERWKIYIEQLPTITNNKMIEIFKLATEEIRRIARDNTFRGSHGLNASVGGEHRWISSYLQTEGKVYGYWREPGSGSGVRWVYFESNPNTWRYNNQVLGFSIKNQDLRILAKILRSMNLFDLVNPILWQKSLQINDTYRLKMTGAIYHYLGGYSIIMTRDKNMKQGFIFRYTKRGITAGNPSLLLQRLIDHSDFDIKEIFFDFQYFIYCATAALMGHYDLDHKVIKNTFMTEKQFNDRYNFTLDDIEEAIAFLKEVEYQQQFILKGQKVLQPKTINT